MTETIRQSGRKPAAGDPAPAAVDAPRPDVAPIVRSKIQPPALRPTTLSRQRLLDQLQEASACRVTLLVAEAGYGKTTLLADFAEHSGLRTLWYRLDANDADPITWANYLIAAAQEHVPDFGRSTKALLSQVSAASPPHNVIVASLVEELRELGDVPTALVLDDFHAVDTSTEARDFVERLVRDGPPWLRLIIATRRRPTLQLGRLDAMGELAQVSTDDLRFSLPEIESLFTDAYGHPLDSDVLANVDVRTQGWAASLQLFYGSIRGKTSTAVRTLARSLSGATSPVYDFLAEEVLGNVSDEIEQFMVRASILDLVSTGTVVALFTDVPESPSIEKARAWMEEADRLGLLSRTSQTSETRHIHPLLRDFLSRRLAQRMDRRQINKMHVRVAKAVQELDPLVASQHYLEAGQHAEAMQCLGSSVMLTMGSGQWGVASGLVERLRGVPADPAVAAIHARKLIEEGDLAGAGRLLDGVDVSTSPPDVRAVFRHAKLSLGWRTGDRDLMFATLDEVKRDAETPHILGQIFQIFVDASSVSPVKVPYSTLAQRMQRMAEEQAAAGHGYYAAISLHNAAITLVAAGRFREAVGLARRALDAFDRIPGVDDERFSTHAVLAMCAFELGDLQEGEERIRTALSSGKERGDVHAECAYALLTVGEQSRASNLLLTAADLEREGRSDVAGHMLMTFIRSVMVAPSDPQAALELLREIPAAMPLDTGYDLDRKALIAVAYLLQGDGDSAAEVGQAALRQAASKGSRRSEARLGLVLAMAHANPSDLREALAFAESVGEMAILATADAIGRSLWLIPEGPPPLRRSIRTWPRRWLPVLRRMLDEGGTANAAVAASLLDEFGELSDVSRLRAFAKTYRRQLRGSAGVGRALARKVSPALEILDLGRSHIVVGDRAVPIANLRRKSAALLMFLVTRPGHTATREQALEELWPESDPEAAANNLNQSLYYLRRGIDPWYEDDVSVEYVCLQGDVLWLEPTLTTVASADLVADVRAAMAGSVDAGAAADLLNRYLGQFSPEFEYEEWAIAWRSRVHALYLQFATDTMDKLINAGRLPDARDAALSVLSQDPAASEVERKLVWLYWNLGARSAALTQFEHLTSHERADGNEVSSFDALTRDSGPE